ncbi:MAG: NAD(P)H-hydrate epimerase [Candidatus Diapherotrites archaeon]|nr:NAD(P)H-hydrate epimerase [Candidatus Diapherotrites archaeon]
MKFVTVEEMRAWEKGKDHLQLMEHAGKAVAEELKKLMKQGVCSNIVFICGSGNNGGDCFTAARHLPDSKVYAPFETKTTEAEINREKLSPDRFVDSIDGFDCIVDCLLGIGIKGELREPIRGLVNEINARKKAGVFIVSVDVPTGIGTELEVDADLTICLGFPKQGMQGKKFVVKEL